MKEKFLKGLKLGQKLMLGFGTILAVMAIIALFSYWGIDRLSETTAWKTHTFAVKAALQQLKRLAIDAETGQRGFLLTGREEYLEPYNSALVEIKADFSELRKLIEDNPEQMKRLREVEKKAQEKMDELLETINLKRSGSINEAIAIVTSGRGKKIMDELRKSIEEMQDAEDRLLLKREREADRAKQIANIISIGGTFTAVVFGALVALLITSSSRRTLNGAINVISSTSTQIASTVEQHERTATEQAASMNETTTTVDELGTSSRQSLEQADAVAAMAKEALSTTEEGVRMARQASDGMVRMKEKVEGIGGQILQLSEQTGQIGKIATMITDITGQINMLALNAAVEAVRAGEQGKGFAVIAQEVRKLADQGKKSAEQANTFVSDIQKATNSTVMVTEEGTKTVNEVAEIAGKAGEAFTSLSTVATRVYENVKQVSLNQKQQSAAIKQVTEAMSSINAGAKETAAGISQTKIGIQRLNEAAQNLKDMV